MQKNGRIKKIIICAAPLGGKDPKNGQFLGGPKGAKK